MKIEIADDMGFCFGVKRAIKIARETARESDENIWTLGSIIHNPQVVEKLKKEGISPVESLDDIKSGYVIIRSHGVHPEVLRGIRNKKLKAVDATCPLVKRAQEKAKQLASEGYETYVVGEKEHPEVQGIVGSSEGNVKVIDTHEDYNIEFGEKVGLVAQTTQSLEALEEVIERALKQAKELKVFNTICNVTSKRQKEVRELADKSDIVIVIGGKKSANTSRLAAIAEEEGCETHHIENSEELNENWFNPDSRIAIASGASTPDWIIKEVVKKVEAINKKGGNTT